MKVKSPSRVRLSATPWSAAYPAPPSMGFSRQEYWSGVPCLLQNKAIREGLIEKVVKHEGNVKVQRKELCHPQTTNMENMISSF